MNEQEEKEQIIQDIVEQAEDNLVADMMYQVKILKETLEIMPLDNLKKYKEYGI